MTKNKNEADLYLQEYPRLLEWINQCVSCQHRGHKPELPDEIHPGIAARNLRKYFQELHLNENGLCPQCADAHSPGTGGDA